MVIVLGAVFFAAAQYIRARLWESEVQKSENLNAIATTLIEDAMMAGRKDKIYAALNTLGQTAGNQQLNSIAVYDDDYVLTSFASGFPGGPAVSSTSMPANVEDPSCWGCHQLAPEERPSNLVVTVQGETVIRNSVPLYNEDRCQTCHGTGKKVLGDIMVDYSQEQFTQSYNTIMLGLTIGIALAIILVATVLYQLTRRIVLKPIGEMAEVMTSGTLDRQIEVQSRDEIGVLARSFNSMSAQLRDLIGTLEQRIAQRTKALETSAEVSRRLASVLDFQQLAKDVVNEVQSSFHYYYAQIYLFDDNRENLVLTAGTGEAGEAMLRRGHSLPKGRGLVGRAAQTNTSVFIPDVKLEAGWLPNDLLPDTRAEVAIPIRIGDQVLGVLDVQDNENDKITQADVTLLESLAGQVAISLQNARLYTRAEESLQEAQSLVSYASDAILVLDLTTGLFTEANGNAEKIFGMSRQELMSSGPAQVSPAWQPDGQSSNDKAMEQINLAMQQGSISLEWTHLNASGDEFPCEVRLVRLPGEHPRLRVSILDITERKRLEELTARRARQLAAVAQVATASSQELNVQKMLETVVRLTQRRFDLYHAHVFTYDAAMQELNIVACGWKEGEEQEGHHGATSIPMTQEVSLVARAARTRQPVLVNDVRNDPNWLPNPQLPDTRSELAVPLLIGDRVLGVLDVQSDRLNAFTEEDANIQLTLASQIAVSLQNAYSYNQAQKQAEREALLNTINQRIQSATSVEAVLQIAARELGHALKVPRTIAQISLKDQK
jgi:PAS domain S-box-containing protein